MTYIQPGVQTASYKDVDDVLKGEVVALPIVANDDLANKGDWEIKGFACVEILRGLHQGNEVNGTCKGGAIIGAV